jgi:hypothetical protein
VGNDAQLVYKPWKPTVHPRLSNPFKRRHYRENWSGKKWKDIRSIFDVIRDGDILLHHPYQSFSSSTQRFVEEAARVRLRLLLPASRLLGHLYCQIRVLWTSRAPAGSFF